MATLRPRRLLVYTITFGLVYLLWTLATRFRSGQGFEFANVEILRPSTLVFSRSELQRVWQWEIARGHYPSYQKRV